MILLAFIFGITLAFFAYRRPRQALVALVFMLPVYVLRLSVAGVPTTVLEVAIWAVAVGWFAHQWKTFGPPHARLRESLGSKNPFRSYVWPILLWLVVSTMAMMYSPNPLAALGIWKAYFVEPLMVFVMVVVSFKNRDERWWLVWALGATAVLMAGLAWYQKFTGLWLPEPWASNLPLRVTSWYSYPNAVGLYLAPIIALFFVLVLAEKKSTWYILLRGFVVVLSVGAVIFAVSKGAWIGVVVGCFAGALLLPRKAQMPIWLKWGSLTYRRVVGIVFISLALIVLSVAPLRSRVLDEFLFQSPSGKMRLVVWQETAAMLQNRPILGAGLAGYQTALIPYHNPWHKEVSPYALEIFLYPHNVFLNFWSELGLAGLLVFVWLEIVFFREAWKKRSSVLAVAAMAGMTALLVHGLVDAPYFKNDLAVLFWIIMALSLLEPVFHVSHRDAKWFDMIAAGEKNVEARLYDMKRQAYRVGDAVILVRRPEGKEILVEIVDLHFAPSFADLLEKVPAADFGFSSPNHGLQEIAQYYSKEDEAVNGVVGIRFQPLR